MKPVSPFRLDLTVWTLRRRSHNIVDRWDGTTYRRVLPLPTGTVEVALTQPAPPETARLKVAVEGRPVSAAVRSAVTTALERLLGLRIDLTEFYQFAAHDRKLGPLVRRFRGMKPPRFATIFEGVVNAIACQQLSLTFGVHLLNRLAAAFGAAFGQGDETVHAFPRPEDLARLSSTDLRPFGFSSQKGRAIIELARSVDEGQLDLEALAALSDEDAVNRLCELRGVGRWTAEYVLLRGLGRTHVFPGDDVGARKNLQRWLHLAKPLDYEGVRKTQARWDGYSGLVYFHLLLDRLAEAGQVAELPRREPAASVPGKECIDVASEDSFPASDAPSWIGVMGTGPPGRPGRSEGA
jgi:DNA-3-methyladenine glycosylase II